MSLTRRQIATLKFYRDHRSKSLTMTDFMLRSSLRSFLLIVMGAVAAVVADLAGIPTVGFVFAGMMIGAVLRDFGLYRYSVQLWPVLHAVLDWNRIDQLLSVAEQR